MLNCGIFKFYKYVHQQSYIRSYVNLSISSTYQDIPGYVKWNEYKDCFIRPNDLWVENFLLWGIYDWEQYMLS